MFLLIGLAIMLAVGVVVILKAEEYDTLHLVGVIVSIVSGAILLVALIILPIQYHSTKAEVDRYYALKDTIEKAREEGASEIERAALIQEIAEYNKDLASVKYWNVTTFGIYYYDGLAELEYLE